MSKKPKYLQFDNLDDRREIFHLLERLPPWQRVAWLKWCCRHPSVAAGPVKPQVSAARTTGDSREIFFDLWALAAQYNLDVNAAVLRLVDMVRRRERTPKVVGELLRAESKARLGQYGTTANKALLRPTT